MPFGTIDIKKGTLSPELSSDEFNLATLAAPLSAVLSKSKIEENYEDVPDEFGKETKIIFCKKILGEKIQDSPKHKEL